MLVVIVSSVRLILKLNYNCKCLEMTHKIIWRVYAKQSQTCEETIPSTIKNCVLPVSTRLNSVKLWFMIYF